MSSFMTFQNSAARVSNRGFRYCAISSSMFGKKPSHHGRTPRPGLHVAGRCTSVHSAYVDIASTGINLPTQRFSISLVSSATPSFRSQNTFWYVSSVMNSIFNFVFDCTSFSFVNVYVRSSLWDCDVFMMSSCFFLKVKEGSCWCLGTGVIGSCKASDIRGSLAMVLGFSSLFSSWFSSDAVIASWSSCRIFLRAWERVLRGSMSESFDTWMMVFEVLSVTPLRLGRLGGVSASSWLCRRLPRLASFVGVDGRLGCFVVFWVFGSSVGASIRKERFSVKVDFLGDHSAGSPRSLVSSGGPARKRTTQAWLKIFFISVSDIMTRCLSVNDESDEDDCVASENSKMMSRDVNENENEIRQRKRSTEIVFWFFFFSIVDNTFEKKRTTRIVLRFSSSLSKTKLSRRRRQRESYFDFSSSLSDTQQKTTTWWQFAQRSAWLMIATKTALSAEDSSTVRVRSGAGRIPRPSL